MHKEVKFNSIICYTSRQGTFIYTAPFLRQSALQAIDRKYMCDIRSLKSIERFKRKLIKKQLESLYTLIKKWLQLGHILVHREADLITFWLNSGEHQLTRPCRLTWLAPSKHIGYLYIFWAKWLYLKNNSVLQVQGSNMIIWHVFSFLSVCQYFICSILNEFIIFVFLGCQDTYSVAALITTDI